MSLLIVLDRPFAYEQCAEDSHLELPGHGTLFRPTSLL
jgi:hypothetical protein